MTNDRIISSEEWAEHRASVEVLARILVGDVHRAEDLAQDACVAALEQSTDQIRSPTHWFTGILRNLARQRAREDDRRKTRERAVADSDVDDSEERMRRFSAFRSVVENLNELDEPYRGTLLMRFFDDLPPRDIAQRTGVSVRTVHSQVTRGLKLLRERLNREYGDGSAWSIGLIALCHPEVRTSNAPTGEASSVFKVLLPVCLIAASVLALVTYSGEKSDMAHEVVTSKNNVSVRTALLSDLKVDREGRQPFAVSAQVDASGTSNRVLEPIALAPSPGFQKVTGQVVDLMGFPVNNVWVRFEGGTIWARPNQDARFQPEENGHLEVSPNVDGSESQRVRADSAGRFSIAVPSGKPGRILASGMGYEAVISSVVPAAGEQDLQLVVARSTTLRGVVVDAASLAIEGVCIRFRPSNELVANFNRTRGTWMSVDSIAYSDSEGRFELGHVYDLKNARLSVTHPDYYFGSRILESWPPWDLDITLRRPKRADLITGRVIDLSGNPVADAGVALGMRLVTTDASGRFEVSKKGYESVGKLRAASRGVQPGLFQATCDPDGTYIWPEDMVIQLGGPALALEGQVIDADNHPVEGALVFVADPTPFTKGYQLWFVENFINGVEAGIFVSVRTDQNGHFKLPALVNREYLLHAVDDKLVTGERKVQAGTTGVSLLIPTDLPRPLLAGRVLMKNGQPASGITVTPRMRYAEVVFPGPKTVTIDDSGTATTTDQNGFFELPDLSPDCFIQVSGHGILTRDYKFTTEQDRSDVLVIAASPAQIQLVVSPDSERITEFRLFANDGTLAKIRNPDSNSNSLFARTASKTSVRGDRTLVVIAPDTVTEMAVFAGQREVARLSIELSLDSLNVFEFSEAGLFAIDLR